MKKIKVLWICAFSNVEIRQHLHLKKHPIKSVLRGQFRNVKYDDFAIWNTNAIKQFEKYEDIELHIISPFIGLKKELETFELNGINYYFFKSQNEDFFNILNRVFFHNWGTFSKDRNLFKELFSRIQPDIVHLIGAENPHYSILALDVPSTIPLITSLQTLLSDPEFYNKYKIKKWLYDYKSDLEKQIIKRSDYVATTAQEFIEIINKTISSNIKYLPLKLALGVDLSKSACHKDYDFVYFAANINKAVDLAIEAFAIACKQNSALKLNIIGGYSSSYKLQIDKRIKELGIINNVFFSGRFPLYNDVLKQVQKSKIALLPLKIDLVSSTIREAMALGLPVVSTITAGTPELNKDKKTCLLSEIGNHEKLAENMILLLRDTELFETCRENGYELMIKISHNEANMNEWRASYHKILKE